MNYKFLSALAVATCMYFGVKADTTITPVKQPTVVALPVTKIGYVDLDYVFKAVPEFQKKIIELESFHKQLINQITAKHKEYEEKAQAYQQHRGTFTEAQDKQKIEELTRLQVVVQELEAGQHAKLGQKQQDLLTPIQNQVLDMINKVAEEHHYTFILNKQTGGLLMVLYGQKTYDISELVVEKLQVMTPKEVKAPVVGRPQNAGAAKVSTQERDKAAKNVKKKK